MDIIVNCSRHFFFSILSCEANREPDRLKRYFALHAASCTSQHIIGGGKKSCAAVRRIR
jgi:hypothetical protein